MSSSKKKEKKRDGPRIPIQHSVHYNAALAQQARSQWFRNRKDIPILNEAVKRKIMADPEEKVQAREMNSLPQVNLDPNDVFSKKTDARIKWIDKCVKLASLNRLNLQLDFYQIIIHPNFIQDSSVVQEKIIFFKLMRHCLKYLSVKQAGHLCSANFSLYEKFGHLWQEERARLQAEEDSDNDDDDESESSSSESEDSRVNDNRYRNNSNGAYNKNGPGISNDQRNYRTAPPPQRRGQPTEYDNSNRGYNDNFRETRRSSRSRERRRDNLNQGQDINNSVTVNSVIGSHQSRSDQRRYQSEDERYNWSRDVRGKKPVNAETDDRLISRRDIDQGYDRKNQDVRRDLDYESRRNPDSRRDLHYDQRDRDIENLKHEKYDSDQYRNTSDRRNANPNLESNSNRDINLNVRSQAKKYGTDIGRQGHDDDYDRNRSVKSTNKYGTVSDSDDKNQNHHDIKSEIQTTSRKARRPVETEENLDDRKVMQATSAMNKRSHNTIDKSRNYHMRGDRDDENLQYYDAREEVTQYRYVDQRQRDRQYNTNRNHNDHQKHNIDITNSRKQENIKSSQNAPEQFQSESEYQESEDDEQLSVVDHDQNRSQNNCRESNYSHSPPPIRARNDIVLTANRNRSNTLQAPQSQAQSQRLNRPSRSPEPDPNRSNRLIRKEEDRYDDSPSPQRRRRYDSRNLNSRHR